jgi:hypothetical protein
VSHIWCHADADEDIDGAPLYPGGDLIGEAMRHAKLEREQATLLEHPQQAGKAPTPVPPDEEDIDGVPIE